MIKSAFSAGKLPRKATMGKPKPLNMPSCILLSPESMMKLDGMSMRSLYIEMGQESFFKGMERFQQKKPKKIPTRLLQSMKRIFDGMPDSEIRTLSSPQLQRNAALWLHDLMYVKTRQGHPKSQM